MAFPASRRPTPREFGCRSRRQGFYASRVSPILFRSGSLFQLQTYREMMMDGQMIQFDDSCPPLDISEEVNIYGHIRSVSLDNNSAQHSQLEYESISKEVKNTAASEYQMVPMDDSESLNLKLSVGQSEHSESMSSNSSNNQREEELEFSSQSLCLRSRCIKGDRDETKNIVKHLQSEIMSRIKLLATIQQLTSQEIKAVEAFKNENLGIASLSTLFSNQEFANKFKGFFDSSNFPQRILRSQKSVKTKLILMKYLEQMRKITHGCNEKWKK